MADRLLTLTLLPGGFAVCRLAAEAEIPAWLTDGLSQELLATAWQEIILSSPNKVMNGLPVTRTVKTTRGMDSLAGARRVLRDHATLTFEQLSWPTGAQLSGADDGVYRASAQLFVNELLGLKDGRAHLRAIPPKRLDGPKEALASPRSKPLKQVT